jgi:hypothetical protein
MGRSKPRRRTKPTKRRKPSKSSTKRPTTRSKRRTKRSKRYGGHTVKKSKPTLGSKSWKQRHKKKMMLAALLGGGAAGYYGSKYVREAVNAESPWAVDQLSHAQVQEIKKQEKSRRNFLRFDSETDRRSKIPKSKQHGKFKED